MAQLLKTPFPIGRGKKKDVNLLKLVKISEEAKKLGLTVGRIVCIPAEKGYIAWYLVVRKKPLTLQWIPLNIHPAPAYAIRGLRVDDIR